MTHALEEQVDPERATARLFQHIDTLGERSAVVHAHTRTYTGAYFIITAGAKKPRASEPAEPPFTAFEVDFVPEAPRPDLPAVWERYVGAVEDSYLFVPKLLLTHLIHDQGGLQQASFTLGGQQALV